MDANFEETKSGLRSPKLLMGFGLLSLAACGTATLAPAIAKKLGSSDVPSYPVVAGTGLALIVFTALFLAYVGKVVGLGRAWLLAAITYNALILVAKFLLAPAALYRRTWTLGFLQPNPNTPGYFTSSAMFICTMYLVVFLLFALIFHGRVRHAIGVGRQAEGMPARRPALWLLGCAEIVGLFIFSGFLFLVGIFMGFDYLWTIFSGTGISLVLIILAMFLTAPIAFEEASKTAIAVRDVSIFSAFVWVGISLILLFHVVWVIFMSTIIVLYPLKTITPSGGGGK